MGNGINYKHIVRPVKYPRIEFKSGTLEVVASKNTDISSLLIKHRAWVDEKIRFIEKNSNIKKKTLMERTDKQLKSCIKRYIKKSESILNVEHSYYRFRKMKTKWATCNSKGVITYNQIVRYLPNDLLWYITFHEMSHLIIKGHNKKFWYLISKYIKNPDKKEERLYAYWFATCKSDGEIL